jgi:cyclophilin family peptidyl-prolyl cis-trans isomerase/HEAT repeat protein
MRITIVGIAVACIFSACNNEPINKFADPVLIKIAEFQDHRQADSLYTFFKHANGAYRKEAVLAFASLQDTLSVDPLLNVLRFDKDAQVRAAAAIALGQISIKPAAAALWKALQEEKNPAVLRHILESCGKTFKGGDVDQLVLSIEDSLIQEGFAWAYYRLGFRNKADSTIAVKTAEFLKPVYGLQTRLAAANFFMRGVRQIDFVENDLINAARNDKSPWVRAGAVTALRRIKSTTSREAIKQILKLDSDYRVRIGAARALQEFAPSEVKSELYEALKDENVNVAIAAAEVIVLQVSPEQASELAALAKTTERKRVKGLLYEAALSVSDSAELVSEITRLYEAEPNAYARAALLSALGKSTRTWIFLDHELQTTTIPVIKSTAATALVSANRNPAFNPVQKKDFVNVYIRAIQTGDPAVIGIVADALTDPALGYKEIVTDYSFLIEAKSKLSLPKDNEALQSLEAAITYFEGKKSPDPVKNEFNHPIDWELVKSIPKDQKVLIQTEKGDITLQLLVEEAPGSVANFVQLTNSKYFDGKNFHRVVPNFVIQGGCNRGDGWGSEDYSIRSEFSARHYTEGSVGMASAGKDTEGTQWFIAHSPTLHLDGRYTIFAVTVSGLDVVHKIEVGDKIISVTLIK